MRAWSTARSLPCSRSRTPGQRLTDGAGEPAEPVRRNEGAGRPVLPVYRTEAEPSGRDETRAGGALAPSVTVRRQPEAADRRAGPSPAWQLGDARSADCTVGRPLWPRIRTCRRG